ncbi:MAG: DMT family transporter, partial [Nocardioides sp.]
NALVFGLMYVAFEAGLGATLGALLHSLSPVLTVVLAGVLLGERVRPAQVVGLVVGVAGVLIVLGPEVDAAGGPLGVTMALLSVLSLSLGTLGQRWIHTTIDPWWSASIQFAVCVPPLLVLALALESNPVDDPLAGGIALAYLAVVNSVVGLMLLGALVRRGGAGASSSVFFLMPPVTAVMAWLVLGETLAPRELVGLVVAITGVALATLRPRRNPVAAGRPDA